MNLFDLQNDPAKFRAALLIDTDYGPRPYCEVVNAWQETDFRALDSGWMRAAIGKDKEATFSRAWLERARGHSKSADLGVMAAWILFASRRRLAGIGAAGDQDQARLLRDAISKLLYINPWLAKILEVQAYRVINSHTESTLEIISSDAPTSYGLTPDFIVADEVVHWKKRDLWDSLLSSAAKRSTCMLVCISNAGMTDDWSWKLREAVRVDPSWYFSRLEGPVASWITPELLAEQERLLPSIAFQRLWLNQWTSGGGDALSEDVINAAFHQELGPQSQAQFGFEYTAGLDLSVSRDASGVCVLGIRRSHEGHGQIRLAFTKVWKPTKGVNVDLTDVDNTLIDLHDRFDLRSLNYDPYQAVHLAQRLASGGASVFKSQMGKLHSTSKIPMVEVPQTGQNLQRMATAVLESFNDRRVELYDEPDLKRDLLRFRVEERSYGYRLTSPRDQHGHGDLGTAFQLALLAASELAGKRVITAGIGNVNTVDSDQERAIKEGNAYRDSRIAEMERLHAGGADYRGTEGWKRAMRSVGRR